jgi:hypothetical protein
MWVAGRLDGTSFGTRADIPDWQGLKNGRSSEIR